MLPGRVLPRLPSQPRYGMLRLQRTKGRSAAFHAGQVFERTGSVPPGFKFTPKKLNPERFTKELKEFNEGRESTFASLKQLFRIRNSQ